MSQRSAGTWVNVRSDFQHLQSGLCLRERSPSPVPCDKAASDDTFGLHPSKTGKDAAIRVGFLQQWRIGIKERDGGNEAIPVDHEAAQIASSRQLCPPLDAELAMLQRPAPSRNHIPARAAVASQRLAPSFVPAASNDAHNVTEMEPAHSEQLKNSFQGLPCECARAVQTENTF